MSTLNDNDLLIVERNGIQYQIRSDEMSTLADTDLLVVERAGSTYKIEARDISSGTIATPVAVLTPVNGAGLNEGTAYEPVSSEITTVEGAGTIEWRSDPISNVNGNVLTFQSNKNFNAYSASGYEPIQNVQVSSIDLSNNTITVTSGTAFEGTDGTGTAGDGRYVPDQVWENFWTTTPANTTVQLNTFRVGTTDATYRLNGGDPLSWEYPDGIPYSSSIEIMAERADRGVVLNGAAPQTLVNEYPNWQTLTTGSGIFKSLTLQPNGTQQSRLYAIRVDGKQLVSRTNPGAGNYEFNRTQSVDSILTLSDNTELTNMVAPVELTGSDGNTGYITTNNIASLPASSVVNSGNFGANTYSATATFTPPVSGNWTYSYSRGTKAYLSYVRFFTDVNDETVYTDGAGTYYNVWKVTLAGGKTGGQNYAKTHLVVNLNIEGIAVAGMTSYPPYKVLQFTGTTLEDNPNLVEMAVGDTFTDESSASGTISAIDLNANTMGVTPLTSNFTVGNPVSVGLSADATGVYYSEGNKVGITGLTGTWRAGGYIEGAQITASAPNANSIVFTSSNGGSTAYTGTDSSLTDRIWTLQSSDSATGPWTTVGTYTDSSANASQDGATQWAGHPSLLANKYYQIKVKYKTSTAGSVESIFNTFKTSS